MFLGVTGPALWAPLIEGMSSRYKIIIPDFVDSLRTATPSADGIELRDLAAAAAATLACEGESAAGIVGWSLGTHVAAAIVEHTPARVAGLVSLCGVGGRLLDFSRSRRDESGHFTFAIPFPTAASLFAGHLEKLHRFRTLLRRISSPARLAKRFGLIDPLTDNDTFDTFVREFLDADVPVYETFADTVARFDGRSVLARCAKPSLFIAGERDLFVPPDRLHAAAEACERGEYFEVKSGTHYLPLEYGELLSLKLDDFFKRTGRT